MRFSFIVFLFFISISVNAQLRINEILSVNSSVAYDPDFGEFSDFIEIYNASDEALNLKNYAVSDDEDNPEKFIFPDYILPAQHYLIIWADGHNLKPGDTAFSEYKNANITVVAFHADFKISASGETIILISPQKQLIDKCILGVQENDISYGRNPAYPQHWQYFSEVSPGKINSAYGCDFLNFSEEPQFSLNEGFYSSSQTLQITTSNPQAEIRFSFDGSVPNSTSQLFNGNFNIIRNYTIKARVYEAGKLPGKVVSKTYFIGENINMPVIAISGNQEHFYGFDFGIIQNTIKDREIPAVIEYFSEQKIREFSTAVGLRLFGSTIYNLPQKPLSVRFKPKYGVDFLNYKLFENNDVQKFSAFLLRNGGNDYNLAYFRDGLAVNLLKNKMDIDYQDYKACVVFLNGDYYGICEIREKLDENYVSARHLLNSESIDYIEDSLQVIKGKKFRFQELMNFIKTSDISDSANYQYVASKTDLSEYINYMIHKIFIGYYIVQHNNRYWRDNDTDRKWRWIAADMEHAFGQLSGDNYMDNTLEKLLTDTINLPEWSTFMFKKLLQNPEFKDEFIQRSAAYLQTIYQPQQSIAVLDSMQAKFEPQMTRHISLWSSPPSLNIWKQNIAFIRTFLQKRPEYLRKHIADVFNIQDSAKLNLKISGHGKVLVCDAAFSDTLNEIYFFKNTRIRLKAIPNKGFRFVGWQNTGITNENISFYPASDSSFTAVFLPDNRSIIPAVIQSDTILRFSLSPWYAVENIKVAAGARLIIEAGVEIKLADKVSINIEGGLNVMGNQQFPVVFDVDLSASARNPFYNSQPAWGAIIAESATDTIIFNNVILRNSSFGNNRKRNFSCISAYQSNLKLNKTTITDCAAPLYSEGGSILIDSSSFHSINSCNGFVSLNQVYKPEIKNSVFKGNKAIDTDAIDLKSVDYALVKGNHIYNFRGSNSDAVDLGINSHNNLIENNIIHDITDKGVSVGSQSDAIIRRNLIYDCDMGIAVKDSLSVVYADQNTFFANNFSVAAYEKSTQRGGGKIFVKNSILSSSANKTLLKDNKSILDVNYSLSDIEQINGLGNVFADPQFIHSSTGNFQLKPNSVCINSGDPNSPKDNDSSRADMGAYYTHSGSYGLSVHINEFNYHPASNFDAGDWIEIYNKTSQDIDLKNWKTKHYTEEYQIDKSVIIASGGYLIICEDSLKFKQIHPDITSIIGNLHFELNNKSGKISLYDANNQTIHSVRYSDEIPYPPLADALGASVELDQNKEGNNPLQWRESNVLGGSPGKYNSVYPVINSLYINEIAASANQAISDENGNFSDWFEIFNGSNDSINLSGLYFTDNIQQPRKWQLALNEPEKTLILPDSFKLIWADEAKIRSLFHTNFKLNAAGEKVAVFQRQGENFVLIDKISFGNQIDNISFGRYPDGGNAIGYMKASPLKSNNTLISENTELISIYPNPFKEKCIIDAKKISKPYNLEIYSSKGELILEKQNLNDNTMEINNIKLNSGIYFLKITDNDKKIITTKMITY